MERERWQQIEQLYHSALRLEESQRRAFLEDTCKEEALRQEVESLLARHKQAESFLESPALKLVANALVQEQSPASHSTVDDLSLAGKTISHYRSVDLLPSSFCRKIWLTTAGWSSNYSERLVPPLL